MSPADRCLKVLYQLQEEGQEATTTTVAARLGVRASSVTEMFQRLERKGLVRYTPYRGVELTPKGWERAAEIVCHHRLLELYLHRHLGYPLERVHGEAERLQSVISEEFEERIARLLGEPEYDPHGDPIPRRDGSVPELVALPLGALRLGQEAIVRRVRDHNVGTLAELVRLGLLPQQRCRLCGRQSGHGAYLLAIAGELVYLSGAVAGAVFVEPL
ncbi:Iron-dependent repressor IdeR [bacterium HR21]|nr:Iron-dependent repressor IdeR [bacterium HR21]